MKAVYKWNYLRAGFFVVIALLSMEFNAIAQQNILVDLSSVDGIGITPDNIFNIRLQQIGVNNSATVQVNGNIRFRNVPQSLSYTFRYTLSAGSNALNASKVHAQWQFSSPALKELFFKHNALPEGTFEYCVSVSSVSGLGEVSPVTFDECLYHSSGNTFLINLLEPENRATLHEYNPLLAWVANYSFSNELSYRVRVAEMKKGQNPTNAVLRNPSMFDEKNIMQSSIIYPMFGKPLKKDQPYAWTVDAYYKGILLGGAESWEFIIRDDTLYNSQPDNRSYVDIKRESGKVQLYAIGQLKFKYLLDRMNNDILTLKLTSEEGKDIGLKQKTLQAAYGDNRYIINFKDDVPLKHKHDYTLTVLSTNGDQYKLLFTYVNPDFGL